MSEELTLDGRSKIVKAINGRIDALTERVDVLHRMSDTMNANVNKAYEELRDRIESLESSCSKPTQSPAPVVDTLTAAERNELNQLRQFRAAWLAAENAKGAPKMEVEPPQQQGQPQPPRVPRVVPAQAIVVQRPNA